MAIDTSDRGEHLAAPGQRGQRDALRVLDTSRGQILQVGSDARRHLKARPQYQRHVPATLAALAQLLGVPVPDVAGWTRHP